MPVLEKGCCCVELETWAGIFGWLGVVLPILNIFANLSMQLPLENQIVYIIFGTVHITVSALLIKATKDRKPNLVVPWLCVTIIEVILNIISQIFALVSASVPKETDFPFVTGLLIGVALFIYFWLCIYSYYQELSNKEITKDQQIV